MKTAIRLAVCLVMAATSTAALAEDRDPTSTASGDQQAEQIDAGRNESEDVGHGSGEPGRSDARDEQEAMSQKRNQERFLTEVWTLP